MTVRCPSNGRSASSTSGLLAPAAQTSAGRACAPVSRGRLRCRGGLTAPTTPTARQAIPLLTHTPCYSAATTASHRSRTSEPSYSSPRGLPLPRLPWLRVVPFLGLAVVHRPGALGVARSTWSTNNSHRKRLTVGVHTRKCILIMCKIMIPPPDSWDPQEGPLYFVKKMFPPLIGQTHQLYLRTQGSASLLRTKKMNTPC